MNDGVVATGSTWDGIRAALTSLHPGQRRVAEVLLAQTPQELARASASDIAELSGTSPATVVRTCQQLGFTGFRECAMLLVLDVGIAAGTYLGAAAESDVEPDGGVASPAGRFLHEAGAALLHAASTLDHEMIATVAAEIAAARRLLIVAYGWSAGAASTLAINLTALGRSVESPLDGQQQIVAATTLGPEDVCVVVCYTGSHRHARLIARLAKERGARVTLVSTFSRSMAAAFADHNLIFAGRETGYSRADLPTAGVVQFATLEAIRLAVAEALGVTETPDLTGSRRALIEGALLGDETT